MSNNLRSLAQAIFEREFNNNPTQARMYYNNHNTCLKLTSDDISKAKSLCYNIMIQDNITDIDALFMVYDRLDNEIKEIIKVS